MNRAQRRAHSRLLPFLALLLIAAFAAALMAKARIDGAAAQAAAIHAKGA